MSFRLWLESLLGDDVTVEGRAVRSATIGPDPFGLIAMAEAHAKIGLAAAEYRLAAARRQRELQKQYESEQCRMQAEVRATMLAAQDRPPVHQGREL